MCLILITTEITFSKPFKREATSSWRSLYKLFCFLRRYIKLQRSTEWDILFFSIQNSTEWYLRLTRVQEQELKSIDACPTPQDHSSQPAAQTYSANILSTEIPCFPEPVLRQPGRLINIHVFPDSLSRPDVSWLPL